MRFPGGCEVASFIRLHAARVHFIQNLVAPALLLVIARASESGETAARFHEPNHVGQYMVAVETVAGRDVLDVLSLRMGKGAVYIAHDALILRGLEDLVRRESYGGEKSLDLASREILCSVIGNDDLERTSRLTEDGDKRPAQFQRIGAIRDHADGYLETIPSPTFFAAGEERCVFAVQDSRLLLQAVEQLQAALFPRQDQNIRQSKHGKGERLLSREGQHQRRVFAERVERFSESGERLGAVLCRRQVEQQRHPIRSAKPPRVLLEHGAPDGVGRSEIRPEAIEAHAFFFQLLKSSYHFDSFQHRCTAHARILLCLPS